MPSLNASSLTNGTLNWYGNASLTNLLGSGNSLPGNLYASVADSTSQQNLYHLGTRKFKRLYWTYCRLYNH
ncbi:MAG: hypothetical protein IPQ28_09620 [Sphingobacteriales bacterium]|nr:hypothetical protein [Sphingobacteriales bacterium]